MLEAILFLLFLFNYQSFSMNYFLKIPLVLFLIYYFQSYYLIQINYMENVKKVNGINMKMINFSFLFQIKI